MVSQVARGDSVGFSSRVQILPIIVRCCFKTRYGWLGNPIFFLAPIVLVQFLIVLLLVSVLLKLIVVLFFSNF